MNVIPGSPAQEGGLQSGERIVAIDGKLVRDTNPDAAADLLKGLEGSIVSLRVSSSEGTVRETRIRRRRVEVPSLEDAKIVDADSGVAYLRISSFQKTTVRDLDAALWNLHRAGMRSLIVDVREPPDRVES